MIWNPGDDSDLFEGGDGTDTAEVNGGNGAETFTITANGARVRFDRVSPAPFSLDIGTTENLVVNANGGDDVITAGNGLANLIKLTIDGGACNDTITGGDGNDTLFGGDGNHVITGGRGSDTALLGAGDDTFVWNPGDGNDVVEGQDGTDTLKVNGGNGPETFTISANGTRVSVNGISPTAFTIDAGTIENIVINANGGDDTISAGNGLATLTSLTIDGGAGNDVITGGDGNDTIIGGDGNDTVTGGRGNDVGWNPCARDDAFKIHFANSVQTAAATSQNKNGLNWEWPINLEHFDWSRRSWYVGDARIA
jgi:Ca2+-binding RTX toxin-like protein